MTAASLKKSCLELEKVESISLNVVAIISDIGSNFQRFVKEMGITHENPLFTYGKKKIVFLFHTSYMLKLSETI